MATLEPFGAVAARMPRSAPAAQICALCGDHCWWSGSASWCPGLPTIDDRHCSTARSVAAADVWLRRTGGDPGVWDL